MLGCSDDPGDDAPDATGTMSGDATSTAAPEGEPNRGGTFIFRINDEPTNIDPHRLLNSTRYAITQTMYNGLLRPKVGPDVSPNEMTVESELASEFEVVDPTTYRFTLRQGVKFHKNAWNSDDLEFTSEDVAFTMDRIKEGKNAVRPHYWNPALVSVETPDDYTVVYKTAEPYAPFFNFIASQDGHMASKKILSADDDALLQGAVGTGPFQLEEHQREQRYRLVRNPDYFEEGQPYLDELIFSIIRDESAHQAAFISGESHYYSASNQTSRDSMAERVSDVQIQEILGAYGLALRMVTTREPFGEIRVRQALIQAVDRPGLRQVLADGRGEFNGPIPSGMADWVHPDVSSLANNSRNLEEARRLLDAAGYPDPSVLKFELPAWNIASQLRYAEVVAAQLGELGVEVTVRPVDHIAYNQLQAEHNYDLFFTTRIPYVDPDEHMYARYHGKSTILNESELDDAEVNEVIEGTRTLFDYDERKEAMDRAQELIAERALWAYTHEPYIYTMLRPEVRGYYAHLHGNGTRMLRLASIEA